MSITKQGRDKFQPRAIPCVFLGYPFGKKTYKVIDLEHQKLYTSRDIVFHETIFPYTESSTQPLFPSTNLEPLDLCHHQHTDSTVTESPVTSQQTEPAPQPVRQSSRPHRVPQYLQDYVLSAQEESICFATLTNLSLQPPVLPVHCLCSVSQKLLAQLDFTEP